jgi:hypothetical protein
LSNQRLQTRGLGLDDRQEGVTIVVGKLMVVIEDLGRCLNRGDPVQQLLFCLGSTHPLSSYESP